MTAETRTMKNRPSAARFLAAVALGLAASMGTLAAQAASMPEVSDSKGREVGLFYLLPNCEICVCFILVHDGLEEVRVPAYLVSKEEEGFCSCGLEPNPRAVRKIDERLFALPVFRDGFDSTGFVVLFQAPDCSGTPFFNALSDPLLVTLADGYYAGIFKHTLYFGKGPVQELSIGSGAFVDDPSKPPEPGMCDFCPKAGCGTMTVEPLESFDLSTLKLAPPFYLSQ